MSQTEKTQYKEITDIPSIGEATAEKLAELGFSSIEALATASIVDLLPTGLTEKQASKIILEARKGVDIGFIHGSEVLERREKIQKLATGCKALDEMLEGGIETQTITEFYGEYGAGKSVLCHQLALTAQLPAEQGGLNGNTLYLDTEQTFRPEWINRMSKRWSINPKEALYNIIYAEAYTSDHQILILEKADKWIKENNIRLIIIDSLMAQFRSEYIGRGMLAERQQKINKHMHRLIKLARAFNTVAVVTNQVMAKPDMSYYQSDPTTPVGGHIVGHTSQTRVYLKKFGVKPKRMASLVDSPYLPPKECGFTINEQGIVDVVN